MSLKALTLGAFLAFVPQSLAVCSQAPDGVALGLQDDFLGRPVSQKRISYF